MLMSLTLYCDQIKQGFFSFCHSSLGVIIRFKKYIFSDQQRNQLRYPRLFKFGCQCKGVMLCVMRICRCAVSKVFILVPVLQAFFCLPFFPWQNYCFTFFSHSCNKCNDQRQLGVNNPKAGTFCFGSFTSLEEKSK